MLSKKTEIYEITKEVSLSIFKEMKQVADEVGVQLAFMNNHDCYAYGSRIEDLLELTEMFDGKIVIDPIYACQARENEMELAKRAGDKLLAFSVTDMDVGDGNPFLFTGKQRAIMPMMGALNYPLIIDRMKYVNQNAFVSYEYNSVLKRYVEFVDSEALMDAFDKLFYKTACLIAGKAN
jgi:sugar phosphate isomerase/epimerase